MNSAIRPVRGNLLWGWYFVAVVGLVVFIGMTAPKHAVPWGWTVAWCVAAATLAATPLFPVIGMAIFVILAYGMHRYGIEFRALLQLRILDWVSLFALVGWLIWALRTRHAPNLRNWLIMLMLALSIWIALTSAIALAAGAPWEPFPEHSPMDFFRALAMFLIAAHVLGDKQASWHFALPLCTVLVVRALYRGPAGLNLEGDIALLVVICLPLALMCVWVLPQFGLRILFAALAIAMLWVVTQTQNRAAAVGGAVAILVLMWYLRQRWRILALALSLVAAVVLIASPGHYWERFSALWDNQTGIATASRDRGTARERLVLWEAAWQMAQHKPVVGVGPGNYPLFVRFYAPGKDPLPAHNNYLGMVAEAGFPGLALYVAVFAGAWMLLSQVGRRAGTAWPGAGARMVQASLAAYLIGGLFISRQDMVLAYLLPGWAVALARQPAAPNGSTR